MSELIVPLAVGGGFGVLVARGVDLLRDRTDALVFAAVGAVLGLVWSVLGGGAETQAALSSLPGGLAGLAAGTLVGTTWAWRRLGAVEARRASSPDAHAETREQIHVLAWAAAAAFFCTVAATRGLGGTGTVVAAVAVALAFRPLHHVARGLVRSLRRPAAATPPPPAAVGHRGAAPPRP